ncbi:hypothetical protein FZC74_13320 [Sutcliffiella horikoshii]|uniref:Uncharacterized protein n=1 Tax=Sutcliffiella horikoshii TaxID=79883 RepID=A0AA94WPM6_9BACI|nr:hypothetical protein FZC74_13320 [Sutcliffiella horikoshii]
MRPRKTKPEGAHGPPAGKRSAWNGNQLCIYTSITLKKGVHKRTPFVILGKLLIWLGNAHLLDLLGRTCHLFQVQHQ